MIINLQDMSPSSTYHLLTQTVIPRPIAWVLSKNTAGADYNLAPFSFFTAVASDPALLMLSFAVKDESGTHKDTLSNILEQKQFTIHIATNEQMQAVQDTAMPLPYGESELALIPQQLTDFENTSLKRLEQVPIAFACELYEHQTIGNQSQHLVFAQVKHCYIDDHTVSGDGKKIQIDAATIDPLARLGLGQFCRITNIRRPILPSSQSVKTNIS